MLGFLYTVCLIAGFLYFGFQWSKSTNKIKPIIGFILSVLPIINLMLGVILLAEMWKKHGATIKAKWNELI